MNESIARPHPAFWESMVAVNSGSTLADMADQQPVLLVFLRHFGCSFCREAMDDLAKIRKKIENRGVRIVFVHMAPEREVAERFFKRFKIFPVDHISDPEKQFYRAFGLQRGTPAQLFGLMNWIRGFQSAGLEGRGFDHPDDDLGDGFQMPGVFVVHKGEVKHSFIHRFPYDRPDYEAIVTTCTECL